MTTDGIILNDEMDDFSVNTFFPSHRYPDV
jgi:gamma-glutamyltranspeptidase